MPRFDIELSNQIKPFRCSHCGELSVTVWGSIAKDNSAHAVYFANLMTGHEDTSARISVSIGAWGEKEDTEERIWIFIEVRPTADSCEMMVRDPEESIYFGKALLGRGMWASGSIEEQHARGLPVSCRSHCCQRSGGKILPVRRTGQFRG
jgi:hypothetical protein